MLHSSIVFNVFHLMYSTNFKLCTVYIINLHSINLYTEILYFILKEHETKVHSFQFICQNKSYKLVLSHEFLQLRLRKVTVKPK